MAHQIEGNKAFFVAQPAWHKLGTVLSDAPTIEEAWRLAYPHTLFKMDLQALLTDDDGITHNFPLKNSKVIIRDDGIEMDTVGADFELIQPIEILETFRPILETGLVKLEAGGSLRGGRQMWTLGKIDNSEFDVLPGDPVKGYYLMYTGFDGSLRVGMSQTTTRVVCANTLAAAQSEGIQHQFKHTKNVRIKMEDAITDVKKSLENHQESVAQYRYLASKPMDQRTQEKYVKEVLLTPTEIEASANGDLSAKKQSIVDHVIELLETQKGLNLVPAMRGTAWQGYNAVTEYLTHDYGRSDDSRVHAQWFGGNVGLNQTALELALRF